MDLLVFSADPTVARDVVSAGAAGVIIDWERRDKARRQAGQGTQINQDTPGDLRRVRAATPGRVICRINGYGPWTAAEVDQAVSLGADELLLPMVRRPEQVERTLALVAGRCGLGILIETGEAVQRAAALADLPLARVYVGLNDLRIDRGSDCLFEPLVDGTVERVRGQVRVPFGVAGLTRPDAGLPVPSRLIAAELVRLGASFTFLRRSFHADVAGRDVQVEVPRILASLERARLRSPQAVAADRTALRRVVGQQQADARARELAPAGAWQLVAS